MGSLGGRLTLQTVDRSKETGSNPSTYLADQFCESHRSRPMARLESLQTLRLTDSVTHTPDEDLRPTSKSETEDASEAMSPICSHGLHSRLHND